MKTPKYIHCENCDIKMKPEQSYRLDGNDEVFYLCKDCFYNVKKSK